MPTPGEHKTVQPPSPSGLRRSGARILAYAEAIHLRQGYGGQVGWTIISREEAERRRGFSPQMAQIFTDSESAESNLRQSAKSADHRFSDGKGLSLFFDDLLDANPPSPRGYGVAGVREFKWRYAEAEGALLGLFPPSLFSFGGTGREFVEHLRNRGKIFDHEEKRERDLILIESTERNYHGL